jgi:hypothetical protein
MSIVADHTGNLRLSYHEIMETAKQASGSRTVHAVGCYAAACLLHSPCTPVEKQPPHARDLAPAAGDTYM